MKKYTILKNCHYSNFIPKIKCFKDKLSIKQSISFDPSCRYTVDEQSCVNKLFGFCFGFGVHKNSVRFGWTYNNEKFYIYRYIYDNGKLDKRIIFDCKENEFHEYEIEVVKTLTGKYQITLLIDNEIMYIGTLSKIKKFYTTLGFYFGGNSKSPHKMWINYK